MSPSLDSRLLRVVLMKLQKSGPVHRQAALQLLGEQIRPADPQDWIITGHLPRVRCRADPPWQARPVSPRVPPPSPAEAAPVRRAAHRVQQADLSAVARRSGTTHRLMRLLPAGLALLTVLAEIIYPLLHGAGRNVLTVVTVAAFFAASTSHALAWRGARWTAVFVAVTVGAGGVAELVGVHTGWPFGRYDYRPTLGAELDGVPVVIPLAWAMMSYPALIIGRRIGRASRAPAVVGIAWSAGALTAWDLFLDPQMVAAGHWRWHTDGPSLVGIPLSNDAGWLGCSLVLMTVLRVLLPDEQGARPAEGIPIALYVWTWISSILAGVVFLNLPAAGALAGISMGAVVIALVRSSRRGIG